VTGSKNLQGGLQWGNKRCRQPGPSGDRSGVQGMIEARGITEVVLTHVQMVWEKLKRKS
jgi:hypothetical protein